MEARISLIVVFLCLAIASGALADVALIGVTVIDGTGADPASGMTVVISGNRIASIGKDNHVPIPDGVSRVKAHGKFLIPGLWDMHVHLFSHEEGAPAGSVFFPLLVANGVTSVRDMGTTLEDLPQVRQWQAEYAKGATIPRIAAVGTIVDGPDPILPSAITVSTPEDARRVVRELKSQGVDFVKVYWNLPREEYFAIADECRRQNIPFAGHTPFAVSAGEASEAGQQSIEHLTEILMSCSSKEDELRKVDRQSWGAAQELNILDSYDEAKCKLLFSEFVKNHTWQDPTLVVFQKLAISPKQLMKDERLEYIPSFIRGRWTSFLDLMKERSPSEIQFGDRSWSADLKLVSAMKIAGVRFLAGTDMGTPSVSFVYPGFSLHDELALLVQSGLTAMEALQAATRNAAEFLGMSGSVGTIEEGKLADLVLLDANPLQDIHNTRRISAVILNGKLLRSEDLRMMLKQARADAAGEVAPKQIQRQQ